MNTDSARPAAPVEMLVSPRLWGEWQSTFFGSGTTIVQLKEYAHKPHLYIYADSAVDEDRWMRDRYQMCDQLRDYMNGGDRPAWLDDIERLTETEAKSLMGASISAVGPMVDVDPPKCNWHTDDSDDAKNDRARLMDAVFFAD